jgi:hypothetical protein
MVNPENTTTFENIPQGKFFILDDTIFCRFGKYGFSFENGEKITKIIDDKTPIEPIEFKDVINRKKI